MVLGDAGAEESPAPSSGLCLLWNRREEMQGLTPGSMGSMGRWVQV